MTALYCCQWDGTPILQNLVARFPEWVWEQKEVEQKHWVFPLRKELPSTVL